MEEMSKLRIAYLDANGKPQPVRGVTPSGRKRPPEMVEFVFTPDEAITDLLKSEMQSVLIELNGEEMPGRWSASSVTDNADGTVSITLERGQ